MHSYSINMVLVRTKNGQSRNEIISAYNKFVQNADADQFFQEIHDREFLASIPDGEFQTMEKQFVTSNDLICINGDLYPSAWISEVMKWL